MLINILIIFGISFCQEFLSCNNFSLAPPPPGFYPQGAPYPQSAPYPKADGGYVPSGGYPSGGAYPPPYAQQPYYGSPNIPPQNDSYNASDNFGFNDKTIRKNFIR